MSSFIDQHIIQKIYEEVQKKQNILKHEHFFYFDEPVTIESNSYLNNTKIDRLNRWFPYIKDQVMPITYYALKGPQLIDILNRLNSNAFYIYKMHGGKSHKMRIKNGIKGS